MNNTVLIVKNLPDQSANLNEIFACYQPVSVKHFGRRRALLSFADPQYAYYVLHKLHQTEIGGRIISVEYHRVKNCTNPDASPESDRKLDIPNFVKKLYATSDNVRFDQPPPPYLKYAYPKINKDILDSISIALMSNSRFYTQVLHLMNRMNLDPPFGPKKPDAEASVSPHESCEIGTQTDPIAFLSEAESELESDADASARFKGKLANRKRKISEKEHLFKMKAKRMLHMVASQTRKTLNQQHKDDICKIFELKKPLVEQKIALNVEKIKLPEVLIDTVKDPPPSLVTFVPPENLKMNRIPENQLVELPVFKNYTKGEPSNKLYIKNLHKDVTESDLRSIYERFTSPLEVKVMQQGRMKGQAFVTFSNLLDNQYGIVEQALNETNGFILKNKPMVVCFGKK